MKLPQLKKIKWNYIALAFAIPCLGMLCLMLIAGCSPFGGLSMLYSDMYHQYYPFFVAYRRALLSGAVCFTAGMWVWAWTIWASSPTIWPRL